MKFMIDRRLIPDEKLEIKLCRQIFLCLNQEKSTSQVP
jgi:hypothetical protein